MGSEIDKMHHVGDVVPDMETTLELYRKLGFVCTPPAYPTMAEQEGGRIPDDAQLIPLAAPPAVRSRIIASIKRTVATISGCLARFEGTHILVFSTFMQSLLRLVWNREKSDMEVSIPYNVLWRR